MKANKLIYASTVLALLAASSCKNSENEFPDYTGGSSVYFAYQSPVRTIVFGKDTYNTDEDNAKRCAIYSVSGGTYDGVTATVKFVKDPSLVDNLFFDEDFTHPVLAMPDSYYDIEGTELKYSKSQNAHVAIQLKDAFFADPKALSNNYVIPLKMTEQTGVDRILEDKNYVLYCVKYINKYQASYLRRGEDVINNGSDSKTYNRHKGVEKDQVIGTQSTSLTGLSMKVNALDINNQVLTDGSGNPVVVTLDMEFKDDATCTLSTKTPGVTVSGTGHYGEGTEKLAWGNKDRDGLYLDYTITVGSVKNSVKDTLVLQTRGVAAETFTIFKK